MMTSKTPLVKMLSQSQCKVEEISDSEECSKGDMSTLDNLLNDVTLYDMLKNADQSQRSGETQEANQHWKSAEQRAKMAKHEAKILCDGCFTALFLAIQFHAPYDVIVAIIDAYPEACEVSCGGLPLRNACEYVQKKEYNNEWEKVIGVLMKSYPTAIDQDDKDSVKTTALHLILEHKPSLALVKEMNETNISLRGNATVVSSNHAAKRPRTSSLLQTTDKDDQLPLHVALDYRSSEEVIEYLLGECPSAAKYARKVDGYLPLHIAMRGECAGNILKSLIQANPCALTKKTKALKDLQGGETPLHLVFDIATETPDPWDPDKKKNDEINSDILTEEATFNFLLNAHVKDVISDVQKSAKIKKLVRLRNAKKQTVLESAMQCKTVFPVPESLIKILQEAERGEYVASTILLRSEAREDETNKIPCRPETDGHATNTILQEENLCIICMDSKRQMGFQPCKHLHICKSCYDKNDGFKEKGCPYCRKPIESAIQYFL